MVTKILPIGLLIGAALSPVAARAQAAPVFKSVTVDLPAGDRVFPGGAAAEAINNNCLACHSADMVLNQPALPNAQWDAEVIKMHTIWGIELLTAVEFPWDIKPIIRWHHEKVDATGYPDRLRGDEIPLGAQIIGIVDVYDALTTTRSYRPAMSAAEALAEMDRCQRWWRADVYAAFQRALAASATRSPAPAEPTET